MERISYIDESEYREYMNRLWDNSGLPEAQEKANPKPEKNSYISYYMVYIIGITALVLMLCIPFYLDRSGYGTWVKEEGPCIPNSDKCVDGGKNRTIYSCVPNGTTGYGCLKDGRMTYDSYYTDNQCSVSCYASEWSQKVSPCVDGYQITHHKCVHKDPKGPSNCIRTVDYIPEVYDVGYTYETFSRCDRQNKYFRWVLLDNTEALPRDRWIDIHDEDLDIVRVNRRYEISDRCNSSIVLGEGTITYTIAITNEGKYFIPSNPELAAEKLSINIDIPNNIQHCRYLDNRYSYIIPIISDRILTVSNLPSSVSKTPFKNYVKEGMNEKHNSVEIVLSRPKVMPECTDEQVVFDSSVHLIPIPLDSRPQRLPLGRYNCYIACMASRGFHGVLGMRGNRLIWESMPYTTDSYRKPLNNSVIFNIELRELSDEYLIMNLKHGNKTVSVRYLENEQRIELSNIVVKQFKVGTEGWDRKCDMHERLPAI